MTLDALILRTDGVLAETDQLERAVLNHVIEQAGFDWRCSRSAYASLSSLTSRRDRYRQFLRQNSGVERSSEDTERLLDMMTRHAATVMRRHIETEFIEPRPGIRELAAAARAEGVKIGLVTSLSKDEADHLVATLFGDSGKKLFACQTSAAAKDEPAGDLAAVYLAVLQSLGVDPASCLALESSALGAKAARAAGIPAVVVVGAPASASIGEALFAIDDLADLIRIDNDGDRSFLTPGDGADILAALRRAHSGYFDLFGKLHRSYAMKVSDILKDKGSAVKAIKATDSILTLAQRLKADSVGAMVVLGPGDRLDGIISERDIATGLATYGDQLTRMLVSDLMTKAVVTCAPGDPISAVAKIMTQRRFRHMPVEEDGALIGLVSIGDVLKHRLDELQLETNVLRDFVIARG